MILVFDIVKSGKDAPQKRNYHFENSGGTLGRNADNDWVLNDPNSYISGTHARILYKDGAYFIQDESTNGTYLKNPYKKLPKGQAVRINTSDVFIIGDHELQARYSNNDFTQEDIVSSFEMPQEGEPLIPHDDFIFDSSSSGFTSVDEKIPDDSDFMNFLNDAPDAPSEMEENVIDIAIDESEHNPIGVDIADFFDTPTSTEPQTAKAEVHFDEHFVAPTYEREIKTAPRASAPVVHDSLGASVKILEKKLGLEICSLASEDRDILMNELADLIVNTLDSLKESLQIKDQTKQDLHLSGEYYENSDNNPVKLGSQATKLLQNRDAGGMLGMMSVSEAVKKSFNEINAHSIALHRSSKNLMNITVNKFSPKNLEHKFEANGALSGLKPRSQLLWRAYSDMFESLNNNPKDGVAMIGEDFKNEYENIAYSLKLYK